MIYQPCPICYSRGKIATLSKRMKSRYEKNLKLFEQGKLWVTKPKLLVAHEDSCKYCAGTGLQTSEDFPKIDTKNFPHVAIIGAGIGGVALALALLHRGIPYTLYERDESFDARSQGYGLTLQQASKALKWFGILELEHTITSTMHIVHDIKGKVIGEWGRKRLGIQDADIPNKRRNMHISRQALRSEFISALWGDKEIQWWYRLQCISHKANWLLDLEFEIGGVKKYTQADLVVGADGIRSSIRTQLIGDEISPLEYLGCIVILGICSLDLLSGISSSLLDGRTVFQTVNGRERIYMMPYDSSSLMWQLSFPMSEDDAKILSKKWADALKQEALKRLWAWHAPIPEILTYTPVSRITWYPVYDRKALDPEWLKNFWNITLLWDAMHPMSPFKGQGANQAILDALELARAIYTQCGSESRWREQWLRTTLLEDFETQMLKRSRVKVQDSAKQARLLHSEAVLHDGDMPRGRTIDGTKIL